MKLSMREKTFQNVERIHEIIFSPRKLIHQSAGLNYNLDWMLSLARVETM